MSHKISVDIPQNCYDQITAHLQAAYPNEGAGLLLGRAENSNKIVSAVLPFQNKSDSGEQYHRYLITEHDMFAGEIDAEKLGLDVIGIFHSHPDEESRASEFDREYALPWYAYLIVSVRRGRAVEPRVWVLADDRSRFEEHDIKIKSP
jgi:proteasome lid subunit RPN8/RPN11